MISHGSLICISLLVNDVEHHLMPSRAYEVGTKKCQNLLKIVYLALAGVAQWTARWPLNERITGLIPSQAICLGCRPGPQ